MLSGLFSICIGTTDMAHFCPHTTYNSIPAPMVEHRNSPKNPPKKWSFLEVNIVLIVGMMNSELLILVPHREIDIVSSVHAALKLAYQCNMDDDVADLFIATLQLQMYGVWMVLPRYVYFGSHALIFAGHTFFQLVKRG